MGRGLREGGVGSQMLGMRRLTWVWFAGFAAWMVDGFVSAHYGAWPRAELAFMLALLFLFAGLFYRSQRR